MKEVVSRALKDHDRTKRHVNVGLGGIKKPRVVAENLPALQLVLPCLPGL